MNFIKGFYYSLYYFYGKILKTIEVPYYTTFAFAGLQALNVITIIFWIEHLFKFGFNTFVVILSPFILLVSLYLFKFNLNGNYKKIIKEFEEKKIVIKPIYIVIYIIYSLMTFYFFIDSATLKRG